MGKIKQNKVKSRSHIKAVKIVEDDIEKSSSKEFTLIKPSSFSLANNVSGIVKSKEVFTGVISVYKVIIKLLF